MYSCRNSCCLLLRFLITSAQSSLLLLCLHHCRCFFYSHNSGFSSQALPHSHNSVHPLSPLSVCEISSKLCSLPISFLTSHVTQGLLLLVLLLLGMLFSIISHNSIKLLPSIRFHTPSCTFQILFLQPSSHQVKFFGHDLKIGVILAIFRPSVGHRELNPS